MAGSAGWELGSNADARGDSASDSEARQLASITLGSGDDGHCINVSVRLA
jgi:hypothetical protein